MPELVFLKVLLVFAMALAPVVTRRLFLPRSRVYAVSHGLALTCTVTGLISGVGLLCFAWLLFAGLGLAFFVRSRIPALASRPRTVGLLLTETAGVVPFVFSIIAATWLVGGSNDYRLLDYGPHFSFYASLHGHVLGWMTVAAVAKLAATPGPSRRLHLGAVFVILLSFLLIAFGIDGVPGIKPVGVVGLSLALPLSQIALIKDALRGNPRAAVLGLISLLGLALTMVLAWLSELGRPPGFIVLDTRAMVSVHGSMNTLIVAPALALAVATYTRAATVRS